MKLTAAVFDLNGTVLSDEDEWGKAFKKVLKQLGVKDTSNFPHTPGIGVEENWPDLLKHYKIKTSKSIEELGSQTKKEYKKLIPQIEFVEGFEDFVLTLREAGVKTALATSSTWDGIEEVLDQFDLEKYFDHITTGEEVKKKKPDPEIFSLTAEKLSIEPEECLVLEDSTAGVDAAISAGMKVIGIYRTEEFREKLKDADALASNFEEITPEMIEKI